LKHVDCGPENLAICLKTFVHAKRAVEGSPSTDCKPLHKIGVTKVWEFKPFRILEEAEARQEKYHNFPAYFFATATQNSILKLEAAGNIYL